MAEWMTVEAARDDGRVALWEKDPAHPDGEVFVAGGNGRHEVARTPAVLRALAEGRLIERPKVKGRPEGEPEPSAPANEPVETAEPSNGKRKPARDSAGSAT